MTKRDSHIPPPIRAEEDAPDMPNPIGFGLRINISGNIYTVYDFKSWTRPEELERAIDRGMRI